MNRIYRSLWNDTTGSFVAVSENARSGGRKASNGMTAAPRLARFALNGLALSFLLAFGPNVHALPTGGAVAAGGASIAGDATRMTVTQSTQNVAINWQSFSIGQGEAVRFVQPNSSSVALNRVLGSDPSSILGSLSANGKVFLVNPNGILFGKGAQVNVGGLVGSTRNISDSDFLAGVYKFSGTGNGTVLNQGSINAPGGYVALLGANVSNEGVISANLGTVALAAGNTLTLDMAGDGLLNVGVSQGAVNALVQNGGLIRADGGQVLMTAQTASGLLMSAVNNTGIIQAQSIENRNGTIRLLGDMQGGTVNLGGMLDASGKAAGQTGGSITVAGEHVGLFGAHVDASGDAGGGSVLIGGGYQGANAAVPNASATYMSADSTITVDALRTGKGGTAVLWANDTTRAYGAISARGGSLSGDGGLIETSGHHLDVAGIQIDASSPAGNAGTWLLDPADVIIGTGTVGATFSGGVFAPDSGVNAATIDAAALVAILNGGTDVTVTTTNNGTPGAGVGDITVASALTWVTGKALTLNALHDVIVNAGAPLVASTAGSAIVMNAGNEINIKAAMTASALGSRIVLTAVNNVVDTAAITASAANTELSITAGGNIGLTGALTATGNGARINLVAGGNASFVTVTSDGGGGVSARANGDISVGGAISSTAGTVTLRADDDGSGPGAAAGTVRFIGDNTVSSVTAANTIIRFNPAGYANTTPEIAAYVAKVVAGGSDPKAWTFAQGVDKQYDGNANATLQFRNPLADNPNVGNTVTLNGGTATFNTKDVGLAKPVSFNGFTLGGADLAKFDLYSAFGVASGTGTTTASITPAPLTIRADNFAKTYGETPALSTLAFTLPVPPVAGETVGSVTETSPGTAATANVGGSPYVITPSAPTGGTFNASNYTITFQTGLLTVNPATMTVTASDVAKNFGQVPTLSAFTTAGLVNGETVGSVTETSPGTVATATVAGSPYVITPTNATGGSFTPANYTIAYVNGALTVAPVPLTVTAGNVAKIFGETPTLSAFSTAGLVNGDTVGSVTETSPGTVATAPVAGSPYAITPSNAVGGSFVPGNYTITYVNGVLTVTPAPLTVTAGNVAKMFGQTPTLTAFSTAGLLNGDTVGSVTETSPGTVATAPVAGSPYAITPSNAVGGSFTPANYTVTYVNGVLTVTPAPLTVTAGDVSKTVGQTPVLSTFTTAGLLNGDTVGSVTETSPGTDAAATVVGSPYAITPSGATGGTFIATNYTIGYVNGALTVIPIVVPPAVPPVVTPPVDTTPVVIPPVDSTPVVTTPIDSAPGAGTDVALPGSTQPLSGFVPPDVTPGITVSTVPGLNLNVVGTGVNMPPQQLALAPPAPSSPGIVTPEFPPAIAPPAVVPPAVVPPPVLVPRDVITPIVATPVAVPPQSPPRVYVPPLRPRKPDRN